MTGQVMWRATSQELERARLTDFIAWLRERSSCDARGYSDLWRWSVTEVSAFWSSVREYFEVIGTGFDGPALVEERMPGAVWFSDARVNFAENVLRYATDPAHADRPAIIEIDEADETREIGWAALAAEVAAFADALRELGVEPGDRVVGMLPNVPEAIVALLATASIGAIWAVNSPDLAPDATLARMGQLEPKILIGVEGYRFNGRYFDCSAALQQVEAGLPTLVRTIVVGAGDGAGGEAGRDTGFDASHDASHGGDSTAVGRSRYAELIDRSAAPRYEPVPFEHPLWVLFSSGTTGAPKGIVHGHGGMLLESLKGMGLNHDLGSNDRYYVAANTSWMVWNTLVAALATGATVVCYSGSPTAGRADRQFEIIARLGVTFFATGAAYLSLVEQSGMRPGEQHDLSALRSILSTGSPLPDSTWRWVHAAVKGHVHLGSDSGGTDICSGFLGSNPLLPVHLGELQGAQLGVAAEAWNEAGERVIGEVGELVIRRPMPSMPLRLWGDSDGSKLRAAYFERFPGVWTQGDWITETAAGGFVVHGRSDATLNRGGVRMGSADVYAALQELPEVRGSLIIGVERPNGGYFMPLFVQLAEGALLDEETRRVIADTVRQRASARHVPDEIFAVPEIPVTHAGKKVEVQIKKLFMGVEPHRAISLDSLANPDSVAWFVDAAERHLSGGGGSG